MLKNDLPVPISLARDLSPSLGIRDIGNYTHIPTDWAANNSNNDVFLKSIVIDLKLLIF